MLYISKIFFEIVSVIIVTKESVKQKKKKNFELQIKFRHNIEDSLLLVKIYNFFPILNNNKLKRDIMLCEIIIHE